MSLSFNVYKKARQVVAWFLRKTAMLEWLQVMTKPIQIMNDDLVVFQQEFIRLYHKDYETVAFESYLNDEFDGSSDTSRDGFPTGNQRRIEVKNNAGFRPLITTYLISEEQPLMTTYSLAVVNDTGNNVTMSDLAHTWLLEEEFPDADFTIEVPAGVYSQDQIDYIRDVVDEHRLLGVTFKIIEV